jgi:hypothetical protein
MLLPCHQNEGHDHDIKIANRSFQNVSQLKYLRMTVTNYNLMQEEFKRSNSGNACCHSVQNFLSSHLLSEEQELEYRRLLFYLWLYMGAKCCL